MILTDLWVSRTDPAMTLVAPTAGGPALADILGRYVPPRLARTSDVTGQTAVIRIVGPRAVEVAEAAGLAVPAAGRVVTTPIGDAACVIARPSLTMPFVLQCSTEAPEALRAALDEAGATAVPAAGLELVRIVTGWPAVGAEIGEKTLPQEVRFDDLAGVSYSKGCYTGQETVARLHFRGHANRRVVGVAWAPEAVPTGTTVARDDKDVGRVTSAAWSHALGHPIGLAIVRREVEDGARVMAGGAEANLHPLPLAALAS